MSAGPPRYDYVKDPAEIYRRSFAIVRGEARLDRLPAALRPVAVRIVHACGDPAVTERLVWSEDVDTAVRGALLSGAPVFTDVRMVAEGILADRLPAANEILCPLNDPRVADLAHRLGTTRSAAAVELWRDRLAGAVAVIGNAPTALFHLLELIAAGGPRPAAILGFPVGFVGAAESKQALADNPFALPYLTLSGRLGGSAIAAAALNAFAAGLPEETAS